MRLEQFADIIGVNLEITYYANQDGRFCTQLANTAVREGAVNRYTFGNGKTYEESAREYAREIQGTTIVVDAYSESRRKEYNVPKDLV